MQLAITPIYAGLFALFFVFPSMRVFRMRRVAGVSLGDVLAGRASTPMASAKFRRS